MPIALSLLFACLGLCSVSRTALCEETRPSSFFGVESAAGPADEQISAGAFGSISRTRFVFQPAVFWQYRLRDFWVGPRASWRYSGFTQPGDHMVDLSAYGAMTFPSSSGFAGRVAFGLGPALRILAPPQSVEVRHEVDPKLGLQIFAGFGFQRTFAKRFQFYSDLRVATAAQTEHEHRMRDSETGEIVTEELRASSTDVLLVFGIGGLSF